MSAYGTYVVDDTAWPLVYFGAHGAISDSEYGAALAHLERVCASGRGKYALLVNGHQGEFIGSAQRKITLEMMKRTAGITKENCFGVAVVLGNKLQQKALSGFLFLAPIKFPLAIKGSYADAGDWLVHRAQAQGLDLTVATSGAALMDYVQSVDPIHVAD